MVINDKQATLPPVTAQYCTKPVIDGRKLLDATRLEQGVSLKTENLFQDHIRTFSLPLLIVRILKIGSKVINISTS